jgi:hypothetical protein
MHLHWSQCDVPSLYYVLSKIYPDVCCTVCTSPQWASQCASYTVAGCYMFHVASPLVHVSVWYVCCMAAEYEGIRRICTKRCSSEHYICNGDRREWKLIFHKCPNEQNTKTAQTVHSVYRKTTPSPNTNVAQKWAVLATVVQQDGKLCDPKVSDEYCTQAVQLGSKGL